MEPEKRPKTVPGIAARKIGAETVVVSPESGKVFVLNQTGGLIWELCDGTRSLGELARPLADQFGVSLEQARSDVKELVDALAQRRLVEMV